VDMRVVQTMNGVKPLHIRGEPQDVIGSVWHISLHCLLNVTSLVFWFTVHFSRCRVPNSLQT
jgi:hypothetical protein